MTWSRLGGARRRNRTGGCLHSAVLSACGVCMCVLGGVSVFVFQPTGPTGNRARGSLALLKRDIYSIVQLAFDRILMLYRVCPGWHQRIAADHRWCSTGCTEPRVCCRLLPTRRHSPWWHSCLRTPAATAPPRLPACFSMPPPPTLPCCRQRCRIRRTFFRQQLRFIARSATHSTHAPTVRFPRCISCVSTAFVYLPGTRSS